MPLSTELRTLAADFVLLDWRERMTWRMARIRHLERIEGELRARLEGFCDGALPLPAALEALDAVDAWTARLRAQLEAIDALRRERAGGG